MAKRSSDPPPTSQQRYALGGPGKVQGRDHVGIVEGACGYRARGVNIWGKIRFIEKFGVQGDGGSQRG